MRLYVEFWLSGKFYRWGLYYRDPKKFPMFHLVHLGPKSKRQRVKHFFYHGVYGNLYYWYLVLIYGPLWRLTRKNERDKPATHSR